MSYAHKNVFLPEGLGFNPDELNGDRLEGKVSGVPNQLAKVFLMYCTTLLQMAGWPVAPHFKAMHENIP